MLAIPELGDTHHSTWLALIDLTSHAPAPWTLIGAHMVASHAWLNGREALRTTRDADVLVNARAVTDATSAVSEALLKADFEPETSSRLGQGFRFRRADVVIDVLAPDGLGSRTDIRAVAGARTVRVPGGTQALARSGDVEVQSRDTRGFVPMPNLLGALLVTVRAIDVDDAPEDKRRDAALLLSLVDDPDPLEADLSKAERKWLRSHQYLGEPSHEAWEGVESPELGASVFLRLAGL
jgi:hypothetical protein